MRYLFGPVPSRRLGYSLGVDIIPPKVCPLDCLYCQLGPTTAKTAERKPYVEAAPVLEEIDVLLASGAHVDCITFSGSGEPTLNTCLGEMISGIKSRCDIPVTVLTNGALLHLPEVRSDLLGADIVCPSFDAPTEDAFQRINRPCGGITLDAMIRGLRDFRKEFAGSLRIEIMLARGINDSLRDLEAFAAVLPQFGADRIQINTVIRPAAVDGVLAVEAGTLDRALMLFGPAAEIIGGFVKERSIHEQENICDRIVRLVARHPSTYEDIRAALGLEEDLLDQYLAELLARGSIWKTVHGGRAFYAARSFVSDDSGSVKG